MVIQEFAVVSFSASTQLRDVLKSERKVFVMLFSLLVSIFNNSIFN